VSRTLVTCTARLKDDSTPPGRALAQLLAARLPRTREIEVDGDWSWILRNDGGELQVALLEEDPWPRWLVTCRGRTDPSRLCRDLHRVLREDDRFREVRWYTAEDWETGGELWEDEP
jgi:hypothetical protein